jgi:hypothetical protein
MHPEQTLVIRPAGPGDRTRIARLAQLDGKRGLYGDRILIAELDGVPRAALALCGGEVVADPFHPTAALIEVLKLRAAQLSGDRSVPERGGLRSWLAGLRHSSSGHGTGRPAMAPTTPDNATLMISRLPR